MATNIKTIKLGAPPSIEGGASPNTDISVQLMANCESLKLYDGDSKCTKEGAFLAAGALLNQKLNEDVSSQDWFTPSDGGSNIKLDINSNNAKVSPSDWEKGWDAVSSVAKASTGDAPIATDDSVVSGSVTLPVCSTKDKAVLNDRFPALSINTDDTLQQFEDREVCSIVASKMNGGSPMSKTAWANVTSIGTNFKNNTSIKSFEELGETNVTSLGSAITGCLNMKKCDLSKITRLSQDSFHSCGIGVLNLYKWNEYLFSSKDIGMSKSATVAAFLPATNGTAYYWTGSHIRLLDYGKKTNRLDRVTLWAGGNVNLVVRAETMPKVEGWWGTNNYSWPKMVFVPTSLVSTWASYNAGGEVLPSGKVFAIGDPEWQTAMRTLADQYAAEYAGWSADQIATADYSDPYIDYRIFGLEPPIE